MSTSALTPATPSATQLAEEVIRATARSAHLPMANFIKLAWEHWRDNPDSAAPGLWDLAALQGEGAKPAIETRSGPSFSTEEVATLLRRTTQTVRNLVERGELVAYPEVRGRGWRFPRWQFVHGTVHEWVPAVIASYGHNGWGLLDFLCTPREAEGESFTHLERLKHRRVDDVLAAARRTNRD